MNGLFVVLNKQGANVYVFGVNEDQFLIYTEAKKWLWVPQRDYWLPSGSKNGVSPEPSP